MADPIINAKTEPQQPDSLLGLKALRISFPEYKDWNDAELMSALRSQYPEYKNWTDDDLDVSLAEKYGEPAVSDKPDGFIPEIKEDIADFSSDLIKMSKKGSLAPMLDSPINRGLAKWIVSLPSAVGGLLQESGERLDETPLLKLPGITGEIQETISNVGRVIADKTGVDEFLIKTGKGLIEKNKKLVQGVFPQSDNKVEKFLEDLGSATGSLATAVGVGVLTKSPSAAATVFGAIQKGTLFPEAREAGLSPEQAGTVSTVAGVAEAMLEKIGLDFMLKKFNNRIFSFAIKAGSEALQEASQTGSESLITNLTGIRKDSIEKVISDMAYSGVLGALTGGGASVLLDSKEALNEAGLDDEQAAKVIEVVGDRITKESQDIAKKIDKEPFEPMSEEDEASLPEALVVEQNTLSGQGPDAISPSQEIDPGDSGSGVVPPVALGSDVEPAPAPTFTEEEIAAQAPSVAAVEALQTTDEIDSWVEKKVDEDYDGDFAAFEASPEFAAVAPVIDAKLQEEFDASLDFPGQNLISEEQEQLFNDAAEKNNLEIVGVSPAVPDAGVPALMNLNEKDVSGGTTFVVPVDATEEQILEAVAEVRDNFEKQYNQSIDDFKSLSDIDDWYNTRADFFGGSEAFENSQGYALIKDNFLKKFKEIEEKETAEYARAENQPDIQAIESRTEDEITDIEDSLGIERIEEEPIAPGPKKAPTSPEAIEAEPVTPEPVVSPEPVVVPRETVPKKPKRKAPKKIKEVIAKKKAARKTIGEANTRKEVDTAVNDLGKPDPKDSGDTVSTFSARQADVEEDRKSLGLDGLPSKEKQSWKKRLQEAKEAKIPEKALRIATEVVQKPRPLSDKETAGLVITGMRLKNEHKALMDDIGKEKDPALIEIMSAEVQRVENEFDTLTRAIFISGSEKGRALASQKLTINQDYSLISIKNRAKAAKGAELTKQESDKFEELLNNMDEANEKIAALEAKIDDLSARRIIKETAARKYKGMTKSEKDVELNSLVDKAKQLLKDGC